MENNNNNNRIEKEKAEGVDFKPTAEELAMLHELKEIGITSHEELDNFLNIRIGLRKLKYILLVLFLKKY